MEDSWKVAVQALLKQVTFTVREREDQLTVGPSFDK